MKKILFGILILLSLNGSAQIGLTSSKPKTILSAGFGYGIPNSDFTYGGHYKYINLSAGVKINQNIAICIGSNFAYRTYHKKYINPFYHYYYPLFLELKHFGKGKRVSFNYNIDIGQTFIRTTQSNFSNGGKFNLSGSYYLAGSIGENILLKNKNHIFFGFEAYTFSIKRKYYIYTHSLNESGIGLKCVYNYF